MTSEYFIDSTWLKEKKSHLSSFECKIIFPDKPVELLRITDDLFVESVGFSEPGAPVLVLKTAFKETIAYEDHQKFVIKIEESYGPWIDPADSLPDQDQTVQVLDDYDQVHAKVVFQGPVSKWWDKGRYPGFGCLKDNMVKKWRVILWKT